MRRGIRHLLNTTAEVHRATTTSDGMGGWTETWELFTTEPARVSQPHPAQQTTGDRAEAQISHDVYLLPTTAVRRGDRLQLRGESLDVIAVTVPSIQHHAKAACQSTQREGT